MEKQLNEIMPLMGVEHNAILSKQGDITIAFEVVLPEIYSQSMEDMESLHQTLIKAIKLLPKGTVFHKQDWFVRSKYKAEVGKTGKSFLSVSSERFLNDRPFLDHKCYIMLTKKARSKPSSSLFSTLIRGSIVPEQTISALLLEDFIDTIGQFKQILDDS